MDKLIISACICGAEVTKENNPAVPYTVEEVVREAKSAYDAGAALIHLHVRWDDGTPTQDKGRFQEMVDAIRKECPDVIIQPSTGGAVGMTDLERLQSTEITPTPEMATLDCGTCNFGGDEIFINTDNTIANFGDIMQERGIKPECEVFDKGMIDLALKAAKKGHIQYPILQKLLVVSCDRRIFGGNFDAEFTQADKPDTSRHAKKARNFRKHAAFLFGLDS